MKIAAIILESLKKSEQVHVPGFGVFEFENSRAELSTENDRILPPAKRIVFRGDEHTQGTHLLEEIARMKNVSASKASFELKTQTDFWNKKLTAKDPFSIKELGSFVLVDGTLQFQGRRVEKESPDFYGLEEISFSAMKNKLKVHANSLKENHRFNTFILWTFLVVIPILGLAFIGITQKDYFLGKESFDKISVQNSTHRIDDAKKPALKKQILDSTKINSPIDSTKQEIENQSSTYEKK